jgi:hypothetical protein
MRLLPGGPDVFEQPSAKQTPEYWLERSVCQVLDTVEVSHQSKRILGVIAPGGQLSQVKGGTANGVAKLFPKKPCPGKS